MTYRIQSLKISDSDFTVIDSTEKPDFLKDLSKINLFIGENNSGKSRLLRNILSHEIAWIPFVLTPQEWNETAEKIHKEITTYFNEIQWKPDPEFGAKFDSLRKIEYYSKSGKFSIKYNEFLEYIKKSFVNNITSSTSTNVNFTQIGDVIMKIISENTKIFGEGFEKTLEEPVSKKIYIPILRGLLPINFVPQSQTDFDQQDVYRSRIAKDYFQGKVDGFEIFTGLDVFQQFKKFRLGLSQDGKKLDEYQKFLSKNFFENKTVLLIPHEETQTIFIKIGDEKDREIYNLGDGLQTIIIITLQLFLNRDENLLVFIEEPEKMLHPGLQRKLIETLLDEPGFDNFQYFITTHSNHFLDISLDFTRISIYSVRKKLDSGKSDSKDPKFLVQPLLNGDPSSLELLGVRNSSVFLSNCTVWVEGITDRKYFRKFLEMYKNKEGEKFAYKEDLHYSFVEYGGSNITHWSFLEEEKCPINVERLCGKLFLIADNPGDSEKKQRRHAQLKTKLGEKRFVELRSREVENLLSPKVIKDILKNYDESGIQNFEHEDYADNPLGEFLENLFNALIPKKRIGSYSDGKTISDKGKFCEYAIKNIKTWDDLTKESQEITELIAAFIKENNN